MPKNLLFPLIILLLVFSVSAKPDKKKKNSNKHPFELSEIVIQPENLITSYQSAKTRFFDLLHTQLDIKPVAKERKIYGQATLVLKPYFYSQSVLTLDAKGMVVNRVEHVTPDGNVPLAYTYDSMQLRITLDRTYTRDDTFSVFIDYIAQPYLLDSGQLEMGRGIYFIDPENKNAYKPYHMWSQGEEEASSTWFPTIDATNEQCTQEISITTDTAYLTLSNGLLTASQNNGDGTRTDTWKQDKPHAPYLFFIALGPYQKYVTHWKEKEVSYYTFPQYFDAVQEVFRNSPEMLQFYSDKLGIEYPWDKLVQIVSWDYTAGAMENTSAIIYYDRLFCRKQDLVDEDFDYIIAHEIVHQWFGDYVTSESWANITLNESLADYGETMWMEYKYGKDIADAYNHEALNKYLNQSILLDEPIVNYYYTSAHDLFDAIRYEKGGRVLHLLRYHVGDEAFYAALHKYLDDHRFGSAEIDDLRQAFESVTGEDLHWFFNQWWMEKGHPILDIRHSFDAKNQTIELKVKQLQTSAEGPVYRLPVNVDIYNADGKKETHRVDINDREKTFYFPSKTAPLLVNFDADKVLPCEKNDYLSVEENIYKYRNAPLYLDKREAVAALSAHLKENTAAQDIFYQAMTDKNWYLRRYTLDQIEPGNFSDKNKLSLALQQIINTEPVSHVRQKAISLLCRMEPSRTESICKSVIEKDSSYYCISTAFDKLAAVNKPDAYRLAEEFRDTENQYMMHSLARIFCDSTTAENLEFLKKAVSLNTYRTYINNFKSIRTFLKNCSEPLLENGIQFLVDFNGHEETDQNVKGASKVLNELLTYFRSRLNDKKTAALEKGSLLRKIALLEKQIPTLRSGSADFSFH